MSIEIYSTVLDMTGGWCNWSNMIIRVDKCFTFGIRKLCTKSVQYLPKLLINGVLIPCVEMGESFPHLGRFFDFNMSNNQHMSELSSLVQDLMNDIDITAMSYLNCPGISLWLIYPKPG